MRGYLIANRFLNSGKFSEITDWLVDSATGRGVELIRHFNTDFLSPEAIFEQIKNDKPAFVLFWDKDIRLARLLETCGLRLFNSAAAIEICDDKSLIYLGLLGSGIKMPRTIILPKIFTPVDWRGSGYLEAAAEVLGFPLIVKECFGSFGEQVYLCRGMEELFTTVNGLGCTPAILQECIESSLGRDVRINVVGGRAVASMYRYSDNGDFRANISRGGKMKKHTPTSAEEKTAADACRVLGLDFAGVDILLGENGEPILCEVNSNAHFISIFNCTGVNFADHIIDHIISNIGKAEE